MILAAMIWALWPWAAPPTVAVKTGEVKHWRYERVSDRFAGTERCRLSRGSVEVDGRVVRLRLGAGVDTADAEYRIDDGPVRTWRYDIPSLVAAGVAVRSDNLANPSGGVIALPLAEVMHAHTIWVRPSGWKTPKPFTLYALPIAIERARAAGCEISSPAAMARSAGA